MSLRIQQLDVVCETKTKDNVFVQVGVAVQYRTLVGSAYDAYYRLTDPRNQIQSYVFDVVRSTVPRMDLDEAFVSGRLQRCGFLAFGSSVIYLTMIMMFSTCPLPFLGQ